MGELPIDDAGDPAVLEEKVPGAGVALDQDRPLDLGGSVRVQPGAGEADHGVELVDAVAGQPGPHLEIEPSVVLGRCWTRHAGKLQVIHVQRVQCGHRVDERTHHLGALVVVDSRHVGGSRDPFEQQRLAALGEPHDSGDGHVASFERPVEGRFARQ